jgi:hypothetical protein
MRGLVYVTVGPPPSSIVFINCSKKLVNPFRMIMTGSSWPDKVKVNDGSRTVSIMVRFPLLQPLMYRSRASMSAALGVIPGLGGQPTIHKEEDDLLEIIRI